MLHLASTSPQRWLRQVDDHLDDVLIDHAHCEKKAAGTAMNLIFAYPEHEELCRAMDEVIREEMDHFFLVLDLLKRRGVRFRKLRPGTYGQRLHELIRRQEPERAVDRLLVASLIEARSCERFALLRDHLEDRELADFYGSLFESEARHHATYVHLARHYAADAEVDARLAELAESEAAIIAEGCDLPRVHS